jgi:DNA-binding beta-propeller fold protein YncE
MSTPLLRVAPQRTSGMMRSVLTFSLLVPVALAGVLGVIAPVAAAPGQARGVHEPPRGPAFGWRPSGASALAPGLRVSTATPSSARAGRPGFGSALVGSAPAGNGSSAVAVDPVTDTIYVANGNNANGPNAGGNTVSVIDGRHCHAHAVGKCKGPWPTVTVGNEPSTLTVDQAHHTVYVTNVNDNTVSVINGATCNGRVTSGCGQTPATVPVGSFPIGVFADDANHTVYVGNFNDGTVSMIDSAACNGTHPAGCPTSPAPTVKVSDGPGDVDVNQVTHTAYVTTLTGLTAFDTRTCNATTQTGCDRVGIFTLCTTCVGPFSAKVDPANNTIYEGDGVTSVAAIDGRACNASNLAGCATAPFGTVTLPNPGFEHILWVAVDAPLNSVYVVLQKDDLVLVIDASVCNGAHVSACGALTPPGIHTGADPESISLDRRTQTLYVANEVDNTVSVIDASRCNAHVMLGCRNRPPSAPVSAATGIAVDEPVHTVYVTSGPDAVAMIDTRSCNAFHASSCGHAPPTVAVGDFPQAIAVDGQTHTAYVANFGAGASGSVSVLDTRRCNAAHPAGCTSTATLPVLAGNPTAIAINASTDTIYVATATSAGSDVIAVFNGATCNAARTTGCRQSPALMTVGPSNGCSFVAVAVNETSNTIYATDTDMCSMPLLSDKVYVYNGATCQAANTSGCGNAPATVTAGFNPFGIAVDQATNTIYTPLLADGEHAGSVAVINGATCNGTNTSGCGQTPSVTPAGFGPVGAAVDPTTHDVYVTNIEDTSVSVIDGKDCNGTHANRCHQVSDKLPVDDYPTGIAIDPAVGTAYVTSGVKGTVTVVRLEPSR